MTDEQVTSEQRIALAEAQASYDRRDFACKLATLNAHPERWAILEIFVMTCEHGKACDPKKSFKGLVWSIARDGLLDFGFHDVTVREMRQLLAARESEE